MVGGVFISMGVSYCGIAQALVNSIHIPVVDMYTVGHSRGYTAAAMDHVA